MYRNIVRPGVRTSTTINPRALEEDFSQKIRVLEPNATPLITLGQYMGRGAKPKSHRVQTIQYDVFNHFDFCNEVVVGTGQWARFAKLRLTQPSRPDVKSTMPYYPQDKFFIVPTGQVVEVVMTPDASMTRSVDNQSVYELPSTLTNVGTDVSRTCEAGCVIVRTIEPVPFTAFSTGDVIFLGRTIYESQRIEAMPLQRDYYYDCNFVEHKEAVLQMTEDQKTFIATKGTTPDWNFQQNEMIREFKLSVEHSMMWDERAFDGTIPGRPKRHMRGLYNATQTNVAYYNPDTTDDFEALFKNFCFDMAFRYNPNGQKKIGICGGRFLMRFNDAFGNFRRMDGAAPSDKKAGLDLDTYVLPGGFEIKLVRSELLQQNTALENWCFVIDPAEMEQRIVKDFTTKMYSSPDDRDVKLMVEWQGTIAWHIEQANALLRTI